MSRRRFNKLFLGGIALGLESVLGRNSVHAAPQPLAPDDLSWQAAAIKAMSSKPVIIDALKVPDIAYDVPIGAAAQQRKLAVYGLFMGLENRSYSPDEKTAVMRDAHTLMFARTPPPHLIDNVAQGYSNALTGGIGILQDTHEEITRAGAAIAATGTLTARIPHPATVATGTAMTLGGTVLGLAGEGLRIFSPDEEPTHQDMINRYAGTGAALLHDQLHAANHGFVADASTDDKKALLGLLGFDLSSQTQEVPEQYKEYMDDLARAQREGNQKLVRDLETRLANTMAAGLEAIPELVADELKTQQQKRDIQNQRVAYRQNEIDGAAYLVSFGIERLFGKDAGKITSGLYNTYKTMESLASNAGTTVGPMAFAAGMFGAISTFVGLLDGGKSSDTLILEALADLGQRQDMWGRYITDNQRIMMQQLTALAQSHAEGRFEAKQQHEALRGELRSFVRHEQASDAGKAQIRLEDAVKDIDRGRYYTTDEHKTRVYEALRYAESHAVAHAALTDFTSVEKGGAPKNITAALTTMRNLEERIGMIPHIVYQATETTPTELQVPTHPTEWATATNTLLSGLLLHTDPSVVAPQEREDMVKAVEKAGTGIQDTVRIFLETDIGAAFTQAYEEVMLALERVATEFYREKKVDSSLFRYAQLKNLQEHVTAVGSGFDGRPQEAIRRGGHYSVIHHPSTDGAGVRLMHEARDMKLLSLREIRRSPYSVKTMGNVTDITYMFKFLDGEFADVPEQEWFHTTIENNGRVKTETTTHVTQMKKHSMPTLFDFYRMIAQQTDIYRAKIQMQLRDRLQKATTGFGLAPTEQAALERYEALGRGLLYQMGMNALAQGAGIEASTWSAKNTSVLVGTRHELARAINETFFPENILMQPTYAVGPEPFQHLNDALTEKVTEQVCNMQAELHTTAHRSLPHVRETLGKIAAYRALQAV